MVGNTFNGDAMALWDFTRCQRADGSFYGTRGQCRKGTEVGAREMKALKKAAKNGNKRAKAALDVVEGRKTKTQALKELKSAGVKNVPSKKTEAQTKPKAEPKSESKEGAYSPRDAKGNIGVRAKIKKDAFGDNPSSFDPSVIQQRIDRVKSSKKSPADKKKMLAMLEKKKSQAEINKKFAEDLSQNLPKGTKLEVSSAGVTMTSKTASGDQVSTTFAPQLGYAFKVNDSFNAGSVSDRKAQVQVALQVRNHYDALVKSLPTGHRVETSAYTQDGKGEMRQKAYEKMGFSSAKPGSSLFAVKQADGTMAPGGSGKKASKAWTDQMSDPNSLWFAEDGQIEIWMQLIFGVKG